MATHYADAYMARRSLALANKSLQPTLAALGRLSFELSSQDDIMYEWILNLVAGVVIAAASAWITVRLSLNRFRRQRWWERRLEAYERLLDAFYHSQALVSAQLKADYESRKLDPDLERQLRANASNAEREIERVATVGSFLLGGPIQDRVQRFISEVRAAKHQTSWLEYVSASQLLHHECIKEISEMARNDLEAGSATGR